MAIPDDYEVLFMHGGGHGQFAAVPLNLCAERLEVATYIVTGTWSQRALLEAGKYCTVHVVDKTGPEYRKFPDLEESDIAPGSKFVYVCSNETVNGVEVHRLPKLPAKHRGVPIVVDASSDVTSKPIEWVDANVGVLFACASKNIGHPGVTLVVARKDLMGSGSPMCPGVFDYAANAAAGNLYNTTPTFNIEVVGLVMDWINAEGGVAEMERRSIAKSDALYKVIDESAGFYSTPVIEQRFRSRMNVPFDVAGNDDVLTERFLAESWEGGMVGLRTLTPFGTARYLRASLYHGVTLEHVARLENFMRDFAARHRACLSDK